MQEYLELKRFLLTRTQRFGGILTLYVLLVVSAESACCCAIGAFASYVYTALLCRHIDSITPEDRVPMLEASQMRDPLARRIANLQAGLRQQAQPRLLVRFAQPASIVHEEWRAHSEASILCSLLSTRRCCITPKYLYMVLYRM